MICAINCPVPSARAEFFPDWGGEVPLTNWMVAHGRSVPLGPAIACVQPTATLYTAAVYSVPHKVDYFCYASVPHRAEALSDTFV